MIFLRYAMLLSILLSSQTHAMKCYITMAKGNCWKNYDLSVDVVDANTSKKLATVVVFENRLWNRQAFECAAGQTLSMVATFSPIFWEGDESKTFSSQRYWKLPNEVKPGEKAWNVTVCFPKYFANVPMPPNAGQNCECDTTSIPSPEPE